MNSTNINGILNIYHNIRNNTKIEFKVIECFEETIEDKKKYILLI